MKIAFVWLCTFILSSFHPAPQIKLIGFYTNEKSNNGEHSYGYTLRLWKYNGKVIGTIAFNEGLIGDQEEKQIQNVIFNEKSGTLSFSSFLISQSLHFKGTIYPSRVKGSFIWKSWIDKNQILKSCCKDAFYYKDYDNYEEWYKIHSDFAIWARGEGNR